MNSSPQREKRIIFLEPAAGISGDMFLSSMLDLGLDSSWLKEILNEVLPVTAEVETWREERNPISGIRFRVEADGDQDSRGLSEVNSMIEKSDIPEAICTTSKNMFKRLAEVESEIHGVSVEDIHFHEVGALDSIADIVGASAAIWKLEPDSVRSAPVNLGEGTVDTDHGELPVPAPATAELLRGCGATTYSSGVETELTTPTGALILDTFVDEFSRPRMEYEEIGYGLGGKELPGRGNFLRATLGSNPGPTRDAKRDHSLVMETSIDDMNPELFPVVEEKLMKAGALDVYKTPIQMKKNRPGVKITVIGNIADEKQLSEILFRETSTLGVRIHETRRRKLKRETLSVKTDAGDVDVKVGYLDGEPVNYSPEFESCRQLAEISDLTTKEIYREALANVENKP